MAAKTLKNLYRSQIMTFKISQKRKKKATESLVFSGFGFLLSRFSRGWEEKSTGGKFAIVSAIISVTSKLKVMPIFVFVLIQSLFSSWALSPKIADVLCDFFTWIVDPMFLIY